jgi:hypothetical protein
MEQSIQECLFQQIREKLGAEISVAEVIAELLHVSNDSAYRRIRNETPLVLEEARILCNSFNISLDFLLRRKSDAVSFTSVLLHQQEHDFEKYLEYILHDLEQIAACEEKHIISLSKDLLFFHNFTFRSIFAFRYFFWMKSIVQHPDFVNEHFSLALLTPEIEKLGKQIISAYNSIPSFEIWNTECINSLIAQIEYYREAGYFKNVIDVHTIYHDLRNLIDHLSLQAEAGVKLLPGENPQLKKNNLMFFYNRLTLGDNSILVSVNGKKAAYLNYGVLDYIVTHDEQFCNNMHASMQALIKKSTILSNVSEKQRNIFFNILYRKLPSRMSTNTIQ